MADAIVEVPGLTTPLASVSHIVDFAIAHLLEVETADIGIARGIVTHVWSSANTPDGDGKGAAYPANYRPRVKCH